MAISLDEVAGTLTVTSLQEHQDRYGSAPHTSRVDWHIQHSFSEHYGLSQLAAAAAEEAPAALPPAEDQKEGGKDEAQEGAKEEPKEEVIELRVPICCEGCVEKMEKKLILLDGVVAVECDEEMQKVTVRGTAKPEVVLEKARKVQRHSAIWKE